MFWMQTIQKLYCKYPINLTSSLEIPVHVEDLKYSRLLLSRPRLSQITRSENLVPVLTWKSNNRYQSIVETRRNCS